MRFATRYPLPRAIIKALLFGNLHFKIPHCPAALVYAPPYFMLVYLPVVGLIAKLVYWGSRTIPAIPGQIPFPLFSFRMGRGRLVAWGDLALDFCQPYPFSYSS